MQPRATGYQVKTAGWEFTALTVAYVVVFLSAAAFICLIYRDAALIGKYQPSINPASYAEAHTYIVLVEIALWTLVAKAAIRFKSYTRKIRNSPDGKALGYIANAMILSFVYVILFDMASSFKTLFMRTPALMTVTTFTNVLPLALFLILSVLLFIGTVKLKRLVPDNSTQRQRNRYVVTLSVALFLLLVVPFAEYFYRTAPILRDDDGLLHFTLLPEVVVVVYLLPFVLIWLLGLLSSLNLAQYATRIKGRLYRPMFRNLYLGILTAYSSSYLIQVWYVSNVSANTFGIGLVSLMILIGTLIIGYALMYRGASQLYMLEQ